MPKAQRPDLKLAKAIIRGIRSHKIFLSIFTALGLPSLIFSSYIYASGIPLAFVDVTATANFFSNFYIAGIMAVAFARVILFAFEFAYRMYLFGWVVPRHQRTSKSTAKYKEMALYIENKNEISWKCFGAMGNVFSRYERARLQKKLRAHKAAERIFSDNKIILLIATSLLLFSSAYTGMRMIYYLYLLIFILPIIRIINFSDPERELSGFFKAAISRVAFQAVEKEGIDQESMFSIRDTASPPNKNAKPRQPFLKRIGNNATSAVQDNYRISREMLIRDVGLLTLILVLLGVTVGHSKYRADLDRIVSYGSIEAPTACASPLISTSNYMVMYDHEKRLNMIIPHDKAVYRNLGSC